MATKPKKRITLFNLIKEEKEIWVVNNTAKVSRSGKSGPIVFQVGTQGNQDTIYVPAGKDPVCLTDQVDADSLRVCRDLFKTIDRGGLILLDPADAEKYYEQNRKRAEIVANKIKKYTQQQPAARQDPSVPKSEQVVQISPRIIDICLKARHKTYTEEETLEELLELEDTLNDEELSYVSSNGVYKAVKAWAQETLQALEAAGLEEEDVPEVTI